jgi:hypothetical protein
MAGDRHLRQTKRFDSSELATLSKQPIDELPPAEPEVEEVIALRARTATLHDPLTTELLAEVARRSKTMEVTAEMVDEATALGADADDPDRKQG